MKKILWNRIQEALRRCGYTESDLQQHMQTNGIKFGFPFLEIFAEPADIRLVAAFLKVPASQLFEVLDKPTEFARAVLEEEWPRYKETIGMSYEQAWKRIDGSVEFKGQSTTGIRSSVEAILQGFQPQTHSSYSEACRWPDCDCETRLRCKVTGWLLGPEG